MNWDLVGILFALVATAAAAFHVWVRNLNDRRYRRRLRDLRVVAANELRPDDELQREGLMLQHEQLSIEVEKAFLRNQMSDTHHVILGQRRDAVASLDQVTGAAPRSVQHASSDTLSLGMKFVPTTDSRVESLRQIPAWAREPLSERQPLDLSTLSLSADELDIMVLITSEAGQDLARRWVEEDLDEAVPEDGLLTTLQVRVPGAGSTTLHRPASGATGDPLTSPGTLTSTGALRIAVEEAGASHAGEDLRGVRSRFALLSDIDFSGADLRGALFEHSAMNGSSFKSVDLKEARFENCGFDAGWAHLGGAGLVPALDLSRRAIHRGG